MSQRRWILLVSLLSVGIGFLILWNIKVYSLLQDIRLSLRDAPTDNTVTVLEVSLASPTEVSLNSASTLTSNMATIPLVDILQPTESVTLPGETAEVEVCQGGHLVITEVMMRPFGQEPDEEWIEIYNPQTCLMDLQGYKVGDEESRGQGEGMFQFPPGSVVQPKQAILIAYHASSFGLRYDFLPDYEIHDSLPQVPNLVMYKDWASGMVNLSNGGDEVVLLTASNAIEDVLAWGTSSFANKSLLNISPGWSLERILSEPITVASPRQWIEQSDPNPGKVVLRKGGTVIGGQTNTGMGGSGTPTKTQTLRPSPILPTLTRQPVSFRGRLLISEVLYRPQVMEPAGEWIEIFNPENYSVDLSSFKIGDEETAGGNEGMLQFPMGSIIRSGQVIVIANQAVFFSLTYGFKPDYEMVETDATVPNLEKYTQWASGVVNLSNSGDEVILLDGVDAVIDALSWGNSVYAFYPSARSVAAGVSLERLPASVDTNSVNDWREQLMPVPGKVTLVALTTPPTVTYTILPGSITPTTLTITPSPLFSPVTTITESPALTPACSPNGKLLISEVFFYPDLGGADTGDEWVEIHNPENFGIDLSWFKIGDATMGSLGESMLQFPSGICIQPKGVTLIANQAYRFEAKYGFKPDFEVYNTDPLVADMLPYFDWAYGIFNLANSGDEVLLLDMGNNLVDIVSWGESGAGLLPPVLGFLPGHSIERYPANNDSDTALDWRIQSAPRPGSVDQGQ